MSSRDRCLVLLILLSASAWTDLIARDSTDAKAILHFDFSQTNENIRLQHGLGVGKFGSVLEFTSTLQAAEVDCAQLLHNANAATVGGWLR